MASGSAVIVVVDRWGAGFLGSYGNTWLETPALNRFASRSLLCETVLADSPSLPDMYRSYWTGRHAAAPVENTSLVADLTAQGLVTVLVTDEPEVADHPLASSFQSIVRVQSPAAEQCAEEAAETGIARVMETAAETLAGLSQPYLLWIHSRGMKGPWDAPLAYREQFRDEEDPIAGDFTAPPDQHTETSIDPDELLKLMHAYAGQVALLDQQLGALLETLHSAGDDQFLAVTSPRGFPLGEHGRIGPCDEALYGELLQVPLMVQFPQRQGGLARTQEILQPADLGQAIAAHFGVPRGFSALAGIAKCQQHPPRETAVAFGKQQRAIRTPAWFLRESRSDTLRYELFAKPDDRWEVNEVSSRCGAEVEQLVAQLDHFEAAAQASTLAETAPLPDILRQVWR